MVYPNIMPNCVLLSSNAQFCHQYPTLHHIIDMEPDGGGQFLSGGRHGNLETTKRTKTSSLHGGKLQPSVRPVAEGGMGGQCPPTRK